MTRMLFIAFTRKVVFIDLWVFFIPFSYNGVYFRPEQVSYPITPPQPLFKHPKYRFTFSNTMFLGEHLQTVICSYIYLRIKLTNGRVMFDLLFEKETILTQ